MKLYVGNIARDVTEDDLRTAFQAHGEVSEVSIIKDKFNGMSKGFAFVEMPVQAEAQKAIAELAGKELKGRSLDVNEARPRTERPNRGGGGYRGGGNRGGGGRRW
jgi:RNA recognition motif-containing protein